LEWQRSKWSGLGQRYYLAVERATVDLADELICDAAGIREYYLERYGATSVLLSYGAPIVDEPDERKLAELGLRPGGFHLLVSRTVPENHVDVIMEGYSRSAAAHPLVVVGSIPYSNAYEQRVRDLAEADSRIRLIGGVWDQSLLDALYAGSVSYLHGHSVGGTNPSLLRAMGAAAPSIAWNVTFNREVLGDTGVYFAGAAHLARSIEETEASPERSRARGVQAQQRAADIYRWDEIAKGYETLCEELMAGTRSRRLRRRQASGDRSVPHTEAHLDLPVPREPIAAERAGGPRGVLRRRVLPHR